MTAVSYPGSSVVVERAADVCHGDAVITMLADDHAVEHVTLGKGGMLAALGENTVHISMSTISVGLSERLIVKDARAHSDYVAAPVFGRPDAAASCKLFIIAIAAARGAMPVSVPELTGVKACAPGSC